MTCMDQGLTAEQRDVLATLERDLASYLARDRTAWEENWVRDDRFQSIMECGTLQVARGFEAFRRNIFAAMDASPQPVQAQVRLENVCIDSRGDVAWATYDEVIEDTSNPAAAPNFSHNFRLLERENGRWRILFHGCWAEPFRDTASPVIQLAPDCRVEWMNAAAAERLKSFPGLTLGNGVLRAANPRWDARLRDTVARSHDLTGFGRFNEADRTRDRTVSFPVVLGDDADGTLLTCWVRIADGRVFVHFGETGDLSRQTGIAAVILGWSATQTGVVRLIAEGRGLAEASRDLGISINTRQDPLAAGLREIRRHKPDRASAPACLVQPLTPPAFRTPSRSAAVASASGACPGAGPSTTA